MNSTRQIKMFHLLSFFLFCFTQGCLGIPISHHLYPGPKLPPSQLAKIYVLPFNEEIVQIDGKDVPNKKDYFFLALLLCSILTTTRLRFYILPGYHEISAIWSTSSRDGDVITTYYSEGPVTTSFYAVAGKTYEISSDVDFENNTWRPKVIDFKHEDRWFNPF